MLREVTELKRKKQLLVNELEDLSQRKSCIKADVTNQYKQMQSQMLEKTSNLQQRIQQNQEELTQLEAEQEGEIRQKNEHS